MDVFATTDFMVREVQQALRDVVRRGDPNPQETHVLIVHPEVYDMLYAEWMHHAQRKPNRDMKTFMGLDIVSFQHQRRGKFRIVPRRTWEAIRQEHGV